MYNILINEEALVEAAKTTLKLSYAGYEDREEIEDMVFEFALEETREIIKSYFGACDLKVVASNVSSA